MIAQECSLGMVFVEERQCLPPALLVLSVAFSGKLNRGQKDSHECLSELARWREAEDRGVSVSSKLPQRPAKSSHAFGQKEILGISEPTSL